METAITKAEFIEKANVVCSKTRKRIESQFAAYGESGDAREAERAQRAGKLTANEAAAKVAEQILIPEMRQELGELRSLGLPSEGQGRAEALLDALEKGIEKAEARPGRAARDGTEAFGRSGRLADAYGIASC